MGIGVNPVPHHNLKDKSCPKTIDSEVLRQLCKPSNISCGPNFEDSVTLTRVTRNDRHGASGEKDAATLYMPCFKDGQRRPHPLEISTNTNVYASVFHCYGILLLGPNRDPKPGVHHAPSKTVCPTLVSFLPSCGIKTARERVICTDVH